MAIITVRERNVAEAISECSVRLSACHTPEPFTGGAYQTVRQLQKNNVARKMQFDIIVWLSDINNRGRYSNMAPRPTSRPSWNIEVVLKVHSHSLRQRRNGQKLQHISIYGHNFHVFAPYCNKIMPKAIAAAAALRFCGQFSVWLDRHRQPNRTLERRNNRERESNPKPHHDISEIIWFCVYMMRWNHHRRREARCIDKFYIHIVYIDGICGHALMANAP